MTFAAWAAILMAALGAPSPCLQTLFGPAVAVSQGLPTGNGRLTIATDAHGAIRACRWPGPSYCNHAGGDGLYWIVRVGGTAYRLGDGALPYEQSYEAPDSNLIQGEWRCPHSTMTCRQTLAVHPEQDILLVRLEISGVEGPPRVFWRAGLHPAAGPIPELPFTNWPAWGPRGFAAFTPDEGATMVHFRPAAQSAEAWGNAKALVRRPDSEDWASLGEGTWATYASGNRVTGYQCGEEDSLSAAAGQAARGDLAGQPAAVGRCDSAIEVDPVPMEGGFEASVMVAFGNTLEEARQTLAHGLEAGSAALLLDARDYWAAWIRQARRPEAAGPQALAGYDRSLLCLALALDRDSGAAARRPASYADADSLHWTRDAAWMAYALDLAGVTEPAEALMVFQNGLVRRESQPGRPAGSLPAAAFGNGAEGVPRAILDVEAAAWHLAAMRRHADFLKGARQFLFCQSVWPGISAAGTFLAGWTDPRTGAPLHSFDAEACRDARHPRLELGYYMGLDATVSLGRMAGLELPFGLASRYDKLDIALRFRQTGENAAWRGPILPFWREGIERNWRERSGGAPLPSWDVAMADQLREFEAADPVTRAGILADAALTWRAQPDKLAELRPLLGATLSELRPDALQCALNIVAANLIYQGP